ncbi:MAG: oligosaccharide flippase family protein [Candidatus Aenigmarchaeota archaeon]|nr:oligosaccharide flippase family protein [Candidatus Aenigmarchaeota archaeon]
MSLEEKLVSNSLYLFLDWLLVTILGFFYWIVAGKTLLPEEYGIVSTSINFATFLSTLSLFGLNAAIWKLLPEYQCEREREKIKSLIRFSFQLPLLINIILSILLVSLSSFFSSMLKIPLNAVLMIPLTMLFLTLSSISGTIIYAFQNMKFYFFSDLLGNLSRVLVATLLIFLGFRYLGPLIGFIICYFLIFAARILKVRPSRGKIKIDKRKILLEYALPAFISTLAWNIFSSGQYALLSIIQNPKATGIFTVALIITIPIVALPNTLNSALLPIISFLSANHQTKKHQERLIELVVRYSLFFSLPIALFLIIFSKQVIVIFSSEKYLEASNLFPILAIASVIYGLGNVFLSNLYAIGKAKLNRNIVLLTVATFLVLVYPLTKLYSASGMAISYFISILVLSIVSYFYIKKFLNVEIPKKDFMKILISSLISFAFLYLTTKITFGTLIDLILLLFAVAIYLFALALLKFYKKEDVKVLEFFEERTPILKKTIRNLKTFLEKFIE